jgi:hypothetical protein
VQSLEVQQLVTEQKRLVEERRLLKEQLKDTETALTKAQVRGEQQNAQTIIHGLKRSVSGSMDRTSGAIAMGSPAALFLVLPL